MSTIPTTVITGTLGAGKTTIIRNLVAQLPKDYKVIWLKNEYGDVNVDSELAASSNIQTKEILNGCLCCVLVGKLHEALEEIVEKYKDLDRLIIETAGTAYPYPIVDEIRRVEGLRLDGLVKVVDVLNFEKLEDVSVFAKQQASYVDLIIFNKVELAEPAKFDAVEDAVYDVFVETPKVKSKNGYVETDLVFGIDEKSPQGQPSQHKPETEKHAEEQDAQPHSHHHSEVESFSFSTNKMYSKEFIEQIVTKLPPDEFYRIKGIVKTSEGAMLLNVVMGRFTWELLPEYNKETKITFIGRGIEGYKAGVLGRLG